MWWHLGNKSFALFLAQTWHVSYFLSHFFAFCDTFIARIGSPLFSHQTFTTCSKCNFYTHSNLYETKAIFQNYSNVFQISIAKSVNISFVEITFFLLFIFLQKRSYRASQTLIQLKNEQMQKFNWFTKLCTSSKIYRGENFVDTIETNYKEKLHIAVTFVRLCFP